MKVDDDIVRARLCFVSAPAPGQFLLNLQLREGELMRVEISKQQLANLVVDGARVLWVGKGGE